MNTDINALTTGLADLAESPAPPSTVDVHAALREGGSRVRRRRFAVAATVVAVVVGASTLAAVRPGGGADSVRPAEGTSHGPVSTPSPGSTHSPVSTSSPSARVGGPASSDPSAVPFSGSDPLTAEATFGWLPHDVMSVWYRADSNGVTAQARGPEGPPSTSLRLTVYPAGTTPELKDFPTGAHAVRVDAPAVNGREAYWVSSDDAGYRATLDLLRWRTPDGRWAELDSSYLKTADRAQVPLRVAAGVTFAHRQVPLPFRLSGVPADFKVSGVTVQQPVAGAPQPWQVDLNYSAGGSYVRTTFTPAGSTATAPAALLPTTPPFPGGPTEQRPPMACAAAQGVHVCDEAPTVGVLDPVGGLTGWLGKFTLLGPDQSRWTTEVLG